MKVEVLPSKNREVTCGKCIRLTQNEPHAIYHISNLKEFQGTMGEISFHSFSIAYINRNWKKMKMIKVFIVIFIFFAHLFSFFISFRHMNEKKNRIKLIKKESFQSFMDSYVSHLRAVAMILFIEQKRKTNKIVQFSPMFQPFVQFFTRLSCDEIGFHQ